jgi:hypothetical protein
VPPAHHAGTLFPVFVADIRKADLRPIGPYVVSLIEEHLRSELLAADTLGRLDPDDVHLAKTASRSILGVMNDTALHARYRIEAMGGIDRSDTFFLNRFLSRALHNRAGDYAHSFVDLLHCLTRDSPDQGPDQQRLERAAWPDGRRKSARSVGRSRLS